MSVAMDSGFLQTNQVNGHMMMIEKNSLEIAGLLAGWIEKHVH